MVGIMSLLVAVFRKPLTMDSISGSWMAILYVGIFSTAIAFSFQALGQKFLTNPTAASILLSTEALFAAIFGFIILNEIFIVKETIGCILMFIAVIIAQLPFGKEIK
ncbi:MAG: EamA family transporter [Clostridiales bacterium]|nr:EamA family transporter [Clostridiales bacterium]